MSINYGIFKSRFKKTIADAIYNEIISKTSRYYHFLGKENTWTDFLSPFIPSQLPEIGDIPGAPTDDFRYELHVRRDILTTKLITPSDVSYVIPRYDWEAGTIYDMYDDATNEANPAYSGAIKIEEAKYYVLTSEYNVYKCIDNNLDSPSLFEPTSTGTSIFTTGDGYKWKFMYSIPISLRNRFLSSTYMPVTTALKAQFFSNGEIISIAIDDGGSGYTAPQIVVTGDGYLEENPYIIDSLIISDAGDGYLTAPSLTISPPTVTIGAEQTATAECTISGGVVNAVSLLTSGYGYTADPNPPTVTVAPPVAGATPFIISTAVTLSSYLSYNGRYYQVTTAGTTGTTGPTHTTGAVMSGTAELTYVGKIAVITPVMIKTEADIDAVLGPGGEIVNLIINDGGIGYTNANIQVVDTTGSGASLSPNLNVGNIDTLQANVELLAVNGTIDSYKVVEPGTNYGAATLTILGDGTGATAEAVVEGGKLVKINVTNPGTGYTWTDVIVGGNGTGGVVRAIMSPIGGHGSNAIDELNASSIMFYSSIAQDRNQGLLVSNDYRKAGLLKNIREFGSTNRFNQDVGSGCVLITGTFDKTKLEYDQLLVLANATYKKFRILEFNDTQILLSVFNNFTVNNGDTLITPEGYPILANNVQERTIDQFSGDFLYLSVREPFAPSEEQIITIRTVLTI